MNPFLALVPDKKDLIEKLKFPEYIKDLTHSVIMT